MNAIANPFKEAGPDAAFDTVASVRLARVEHGVRFAAEQPIPVTSRKHQHRNRAMPWVHAQVFVVDGNPALAEFARTLLDHAGFTTCAFDDHTVAGHAFAFASTPPELVIVHDSKADRAGMELVRVCKELNPQMRVVVVCDFPMKPEPGLADAVIHEPYCGPQLVQAVRRFCTPRSSDEVPKLMPEVSNG